MKFFRSAIFCLSTFFATIAIGERTNIASNNSQLKTSIFPENNRYIPVGVESVNGISEKAFNDIIDTAVEIFQPIAKEYNETLVYNSLWSNGTVNSNACRGCEAGKSIINGYGGLARAKVSVESYALVASHELSHLYCAKFADTNHKAVIITRSDRMCSESNADYQGNGSIETLLIKGLIKKGYEFNLSTDNYIDTKCADTWSRDTLDYKLCVIRLNAGNELGALLADLNGDAIPSYDQRDTKVVSKTNQSYPSTLCRLNNYWDSVFNLSYSKCWFKN